MKKLITLIILLFSLNNAKAQNLVPNGNFELYTSCPTGASQIALSTGWRQYHSGTSDYFNACNTATVSAPANFLGYQAPLNGNAYAGFFAVAYPLQREYIACPITPMVIGMLYKVSMYVSLANNSTLTTADVGAWFYDNGPSTTVLGMPSLGVYPQALFPRVTDTLNWVRVSAVFVADSAYDNMVIGGFGDVITGTDMYTGFGSYGGAYYYVDSITVQTTSGINNLYTGANICVGDTFQVPYSLYRTYGTGNVFSVQLSSSSGSFASGTTIIGTSANASGTITCVVPPAVSNGTGYRLRILSSYIADTSEISTNNITIGRYPAKPIANPDSIKCSGERINLSATTSTTGVSYSWTGPASFTSSLQNPIVNNLTTSMAGNYIVTASLLGCGSKDTAYVTVNQSPNAITASTVSPVCQNDTIKLYSTHSSSGVIWHWSGPAGFVSATKDTLIANALPAQTGYYVVSATGSNNCKTKDSVYILVNPYPANFNATANTPVCVGGILNFTGNTSSTGVSFSWSGPGGYTSLLQSPSISNVQTSAAGIYIVTGTINGCSVKDTVVVAVNSLPNKPTPSANTPVCVGQDLQLGASTIAGATYNWTSTTGFSSNAQNPVRSSATTTYAGKYYVTATVNGCTSPADSITVTVNPAPNISMYPSPKDSICVGQTVTFVSSTSNAGTSYTRSWFRNNNAIGGASNANYSTAAAANSDEYYTTITVSGVCATPFTDTSNKIVMKVLPWLVPSVSITANPNTTVLSGTMINFTATPTNGGTKPGYQWTRNGSNITGALSNVWGASTLSNNDQICVDMTSSYLCPNPKTAKSNCIKVSIESTGIVGLWTGIEPSIYPNPTNEKLTIEGVDKGTKIQLTDLLGRVVVKAISTETKTELNIGHLAAGSYMLTLSKENGDSMTLKVLKE